MVDSTVTVLTITPLKCERNARFPRMTSRACVCLLVCLVGGIMLVSSPIEYLHAQENKAIVYPEIPKVDQVDEYFGTKVSDPYRWLEEDVRESKRVAEWVEAENKVTFGYLDQIPERDTIREKLTKLWNYEKFSSPFKAGTKYYYFRNDGLQNQSVLYEIDNLNADPVVVIDPNGWSEDGTVALSDIVFSDNGKYLAYSIQDAGSDWRTWKVMEVESRKLLEDELKWIKFSSVTWTQDNKGFFYARFDEPAQGEAFQSLNLGQKIYYHRVGTSQADDVLVFHRPDQPEWGYELTVSEDGRYLIITVWKGTADRYRVFYKDLAEPFGMPLELITEFENEYSFIGNEGETFYFKTDLNAPNKRIIAIDINKPAKENYQEVLPEGEEPIASVGLVANMFVVSQLKDAHTRIRMYDMTGKFVREVELPGMGTASGFGGKRVETETFYSFSNYVIPPSIYRYDMLTGESSLLRRSNVDFKTEDYILTQVFYTSKDGTKVPMFIAHHKDVKLDGNNPTLLYAYGGFNISLTPSFSVSRAGWMKMGGVFALANLRGGGEYGESWHQGGMIEKKQNVFDDFIAAGEWLIANKYTTNKKLAIQGGSNGGLLVGAVMTQRPDLWGAALPAVGVMDMLRFHQFTAGRYWVDEFGSSETEAHFPVIYKYSPYHNLKPGTEYPATMVTTADTDDRVVPGHSFKFAARLQECQAGKEPVLIRIETRAGHGSGKPTKMIIEEVADEYAFLLKVLGMKLPAGY
jgi:prolyl oligopeptidase